MTMSHMNAASNGALTAPFSFGKRSASAAELAAFYLKVKTTLSVPCSEQHDLHDLVFFEIIGN
jgi:hypothetical protein